MNILYVTTRQWNPGDEFILAGVRHAIQDAGIQPRIEAIYNKSPQVRGKWDHLNLVRFKQVNRLSGTLDSFWKIAHFDNSFAPQHSIDIFDWVVVCGSPGWFGGRLRDLYKKLQRFSGNVLYLGIGQGNRATKLSELERRVMRRSYVVCRNEALVEHLRKDGISARYLPCPAILASRVERRVENIERVGLVFASRGGHRGQRVGAGHFEFQQQVFSALLERFSCEVICHYFDEVPTAVQFFGRERVRYAYDACDYVQLFARQDMIVSTRVHGCGLASSVGIPNILLAHDARSATAKGFLSLLTQSISEVDRAIEALASDPGLVSDQYLEHKSEVRRSYRDVLSVMAPRREG